MHTNYLKNNVISKLQIMEFMHKHMQCSTDVTLIFN